MWRVTHDVVLGAFGHCDPSIPLGLLDVRIGPVVGLIGALHHPQLASFVPHGDCSVAGPGACSPHLHRLQATDANDGKKVTALDVRLVHFHDVVRSFGHVDAGVVAQELEVGLQHDVPNVPTF